MKNLQNKDGVDFQTMTAVGSIMMTRNLLKNTVDPAEFITKIRRFNFMNRCLGVSGIISRHMEAATIAPDGYGDWLPVAKDLKALGWFSEKSDDALAKILRDSWMDLMKPENGSFTPDELFGTITIPDSMPQPDYNCEPGPECDCDNCESAEDPE